MKTIITAVAATLFTASVSAAGPYYGPESEDRQPIYVGPGLTLFQPVGPSSTVGHRASEDRQPIYVGPGLTL